MADKRLGVVVAASEGRSALTIVENLEQMGIGAAWMTSGGVGGADAMTFFAAAAVRTQRIMLGTAITQIYPRHPLAAVQQAQALAQLAPGRFRLGIGTSGRAGVEQTFGVSYRAPLGQLREYLSITRALLHEGSVDFSGRRYQAHFNIAAPVDVPVMAAALGERAFEVCGAEADGAISWLCPGAYLRDVASPALLRGAEQAGRPAPPLVGHAAVCVHDDPDEVRAAVKQQFGGFARSPFYQNMFTAAGFPETAEGAWSDRMVEGVTLSGDEAQVAAQIEGLFAIGVTEVMASPVAAGDDRDASLDRTLRLLAQISQSIEA